MLMTVVSRAALALKGYFILHRSWHCAWVMAADTAPRRVREDRFAERRLR